MDEETRIKIENKLVAILALCDRAGDENGDAIKQLALEIDLLLYKDDETVGEATA